MTISDTPSTYTRFVYRASSLPLPSTQPRLFEDESTMPSAKMQKQPQLGRIDMKAVIEEGYIRLQKVYDYIRELERKIDAGENEFDFTARRARIRDAMLKSRDDDEGGEVDTATTDAELGSDLTGTADK